LTKNILQEVHRKFIYELQNHQEQSFSHDFSIFYEFFDRLLGLSLKAPLDKRLENWDGFWEEGDDVPVQKSEFREVFDMLKKTKF
jgi:hypothetical protein